MYSLADGVRPWPHARMLHACMFVWEYQLVDELWKMVCCGVSHGCTVTRARSAEAVAYNHYKPVWLLPLSRRQDGAHLSVIVFSIVSRARESPYSLLQRAVLCVWEGSLR